MSRFEPPADADLATFWDGTRERRLLIPRCNACGKAFWYPRPTCPHCLSDDLDWREAAGGATVHAVTVQSRPEPSAVVLVDLDEGVRLMSNTVDVDPFDVHVGMRVRLTWEALSDGRHLWLFEPGREQR